MLAFGNSWFTYIDTHLYAIFTFYTGDSIINQFVATILSTNRIIEIEHDTYLKELKYYGSLENHPKIIRLKEENKDKFSSGIFEIKRKRFKVTTFGKSFLKACVCPK